MINISYPNPRKRYEKIRDMGEADKYHLCNLLGFEERPFPQILKKECCCNDCDRKIQKLKEFETDIIFLTQIIMHHYSILGMKEGHWYDLHTASQWNVRILYFFRNKIETISQNEGTEIPLEKSHSPDSKLEIAFRNITQHLLDAQIPLDNPFDSRDFEVHDIFAQFSLGKSLYSDVNAEAKREAQPLIDQIMNIEENHQPDKDYIAQQIQLLEKMPVDILQAEVQEFIDQIAPVANHKKMCDKARQYIKDTCAAVITDMDEFMRRNSENQVKEHNSNQLDETLDLLLEKVDSFNEEWEKEYADIFIFLDRSNSKRQRIA